MPPDPPRGLVLRTAECASHTYDGQVQLNILQPYNFTYGQSNLHLIAHSVQAIIYSYIVLWHWHNEQEQSFKTLKKLVIEAPILKYFDPHKPTKLSVDASSKGLGAVLLQDGHPIAYASTALMQTQQNYAQIEKEMLPIVFECT